MGLFEPPDIRGLVYNPLGRRNLSAKDKARIKLRDKKGKHSEVDHKKPVGLYKTNTPMDMRFEIAKKDGTRRKHRYDYSNNLQALSKRKHKKKTKSDIRNIRAKRLKDNFGLRLSGKL